MDPTIVALATTAATTVVPAMASDLWKDTRDQFAALFGPRKALVADELDASREDVLHDQELAQAVEEEWRGKLVRYLRTHPDGVDSLQAVLAEVSFAPAGVTNVRQSMGNVSGSGVQANTVNGGVNTWFGAPVSHINAQSEAELVRVEVTLRGDGLFVRVSNDGARPVRDVELIELARTGAEPGERWRLFPTVMGARSHWEIIKPEQSRETVIQLLDSQGRPLGVHGVVKKATYLVRFRDYDGQWWEGWKSGAKKIAE